MTRPRLPALGLMVGALIACPACTSTQSPASAVTADEAQQLNEAAAMLDRNSVDLDKIAVDSAHSPISNQGDPSP